MQEGELNRLCNEYGLSSCGLFVEWFNKAFPHEKMDSYVIEWIKRFKSGNPSGRMDFERFELYTELLVMRFVVAKADYDNKKYIEVWKQFCNKIEGNLTVKRLEE